MKDDAYIRQRDALRQEVRGICERLGMTSTELARAAGIAPSTLNRFLSDDEIDHLLSTKTLSAIRSVADINHSQNRNHIDAEARQLQKSIGDRFGPEDLPVVGHGEGGRDGFFFDNGTVRQYVPRPAELLKVANAYAIFQHGKSMEPRYFEGELLYVNPNRPPVGGDFVVIEFRDGRGLVKRLMRRTGKSLLLQQYNPEKVFEVAVSEVKSVHLIVGATKG